jgi:hypothetical protein
MVTFVIRVMFMVSYFGVVRRSRSCDSRLVVED